MAIPGMKISRDAVYAYLWTKCKSRSNMVNKTQQQIADELGCTLRTLQTIFQEFIDRGLIVKKHQKFYMQKSPDAMRWESEKAEMSAVEAVENFFDCDDVKARQFIKYLDMKGWAVVKNT